MVHGELRMGILSDKLIITYSVLGIIALLTRWQRSNNLNDTASFDFFI